MSAGVPPLELFPVTGDAGAVTLQSGSLMSTSQLLADQGQRIGTISGALAASWSGEAATSYHALAEKTAGAFRSAASEIDGAATLMRRYATELEDLQRAAAAAARESEYWHQQIATWTAKVNDGRSALARAQNDLSAAQDEHARAAAKGPAGAAAAASASAATIRAQWEVETAQTNLTQAQRRLADAQEQFAYSQNRGRQTRDAALTAGKSLGSALLLVSIAPPPLPDPGLLTRQPSGTELEPIKPPPRGRKPPPRGREKLGGKGKEKKHPGVNQGAIRKAEQAEREREAQQRRLHGEHPGGGHEPKPEPNPGRGHKPQPEPNPGRGHKPKPEPNPGRGHKPQPEPNPGRGHEPKPERKPEGGHEPKPARKPEEGRRGGRTRRTGPPNPSRHYVPGLGPVPPDPYRPGL